MEDLNFKGLYLSSREGRDSPNKDYFLTKLSTEKLNIIQWVNLQGYNMSLVNLQHKGNLLENKLLLFSKQGVLGPWKMVDFGLICRGGFKLSIETLHS